MLAFPRIAVAGWSAPQSGRRRWVVVPLASMELWAGRYCCGSSPCRDSTDRRSQLFRSSGVCDPTPLSSIGRGRRDPRTPDRAVACCWGRCQGASSVSRQCREVVSVRDAVSPPTSSAVRWCECPHKRASTSMSALPVSPRCVRQGKCGQSHGRRPSGRGAQGSGAVGPLCGVGSRSASWLLGEEQQAVWRGTGGAACWRSCSRPGGLTAVPGSLWCWRRRRPQAVAGTGFANGASESGRDRGGSGWRAVCNRGRVIGGCYRVVAGLWCER